MEDKSIYNSQQPQGISENLQNYIDSMVEEIVLESKPFATQKKYLKKFCENGGVDYEAIEKGINELVETMGEMKTSDSKMLIKLALFQAQKACVTEATILNIVKQIGQKEDDSFRAKSNALAEIIQSLQHRFSKNEMNDSTIDFNVNGVEFCMVKVEGGSFWMGAHNQYIKTGWFSKEPDTSIPNFDIEASIWESPVHEVTVGDFYIGKVIVTQALWREVMLSNPSHFKWIDDYFPVESVSYDDIVNEFLPRLNRLTGKNFRLPTEAEWEYAARGGSHSQRYKYAGSSGISSVAWYKDNSGSKPHPIEMKQANELGLYDMSGNVWEWCLDWASIYDCNAQTDPIGPTSGVYRILRGGSWYDKANEIRVSNRGRLLPQDRSMTVGFRLALSK